jgi:hypothetical protein
MRRIPVLAAATAAICVLAGTTAPASSTVDNQHETLTRYAADTWTSMTALVDPDTGLPADNIDGDLSADTRSAYTSPTNVGAYLWSTVVADDLHLVPHGQAVHRIRQTLTTLSTLDRNEPSGMFYNWYSPTDGSVLHTWPEDGSTITPFLSSVDNGWLAAALMVVRSAEPELAARANAILAPMDFGFYYDPDANQLRNGFYDTDPGGCTIVGNYVGRGPDVWYTCGTYDVLNSEPRIASYIGIARGQVPAKHYFGLNRTFPPTCDYAFKEKPVGYYTTYLGQQVFEGAYTYRDLQFVPTWGGDMFEAMMPGLFVPEARWAPNSWGRNDPAYVKGQIEFGLDDARYGYWGFSPSSDPKGGYTAFGAPPLGMDPGGYQSDEEGTVYDPGFPGCRTATNPDPQYGDGVVTPHASFLALEYAPEQAMANLTKLAANFDAYGAGGFYDAVAVGSGTVAHRYLALDQGMILGALGNYLAGNDLRRDFTRGSVTTTLRPLLAMETFNVPADR